MKNLLNTFFLCILFFISNTYTQQFTEQTSIVLTGVNASSVKWGDFDNDGDLDILLTGQVGKYEDHLYDISYIGINNGDNTFTQWPVIAPMHEGSVDWGDYDNDGDLDILLTGKDYAQSFTDRSIIYKNNGDGTFTEQTSITLTGVSSGSGIWGDYDNDGNPDILLTGSGISKIYKNNGDGTFTEQSAISLTGISGGSGIFGDYDNDKDLDILLSGSGITIIYKNNGDGTFSEQTSISLSGTNNGAVAWGDYDNDGDLDILLTGSGISKIYKNNGDGSFTEQTIINLIGLSLSSAAWGDYDNDGDLDILISGYGPETIIYKNEGNDIFTEQTSINLKDVGDGSCAWGDYDNDGDLDILLTGEAASADTLLDFEDVTKIYRNDNIYANRIPTVPSNLILQVTDQDVTFSWDKSYDNETPQDGLTYNLVIGTSPDSMDIISPMSNRNTGYRRVVNLGNTNCNTSWTIKGLDDGLYWWSVQSIDNAFAGSNFASGGSFIKPYSPIIIITHPADGESLEVYSNQLITWASGATTGFVQIDYSVDGGANWNCITPWHPDIGQYNWVVPNTISTNCKIRISDSDGDPFGYSSGTFSIISSDQITEIQSGLTEVYNSSIEWGDFDNDDDLDVLVTGTIIEDESGDIYISYIGVNHNIGFVQTYPLPSVRNGSISWGDYSNDGYLDILLTGTLLPFGPQVSKIYKNNRDGTFTEQASVSLSQGSAGEWGDFNNDGKIDIVITSDTSKLYNNNGNGVFSEQTLIPAAVKHWGDYDNDGDLDLLGVSNAFTNMGDGVFTENIALLLTGGNSSAWGDYNNDGNLDILLTGSQGTKIYENQGDGTFTEQFASAMSGGNMSAWGDYDNDGDLDILLSGPTSKLYKNNGDETFTEHLAISRSIIDVQQSYAAWGDYDNDGDLDIIQSGYAFNPCFSSNFGDHTLLYRNNNAVPNTPPSVPTNLNSIVIGQNVTLSWDKSNDNETPQDGLTYNLVIGTSPDSMDIISPMSNRNTGYRRVVNLGNTNCNTSWTVKELGVGEYYWSVQAIDNGFLGSEFATEQYFSIPIPVELISFNAKSLGNDVVLEWSTATETNNYGFEVQRANKGDFNPVGFVIGQGTKTSISNYGYVDRNLDAGKYFYKLKQIDLDGNSKFTRTISVEIAKPLTYSLSQNYPNPFNPSTVIKFSIPEFSHVKLTVYNQLGEIIEVITERNFEAGSYTATWNAKNQASGLYFYEIKDKNYSAVKKAVIVR